MSTWVRFNDTSKKWEVSTNQGANWADLVANVVAETIDFNSVASPGTDYTIHKNSSSLHLVVELPAGKALYVKDGDLVVDGSLTVSGSLLAGTEDHGGTVVDANGFSFTPELWIPVWVAPYACTVAAVKGIKKDGTSFACNARKNGSSEHLSSDLTVSSDDTLTDGGAVQNTDYSAGDWLEIGITAFSGAVTRATVSVYFTRA